jgi:hypothetical protein
MSEPTQEAPVRPENDAVSAIADELGPFLASARRTSAGWARMHEALGEMVRSSSGFDAECLEAWR